MICHLLKRPVRVFAGHGKPSKADRRTSKDSKGLEWLHDLIILWLSWPSFWLFPGLLGNPSHRPRSIQSQSRVPQSLKTTQYLSQISLAASFNFRIASWIASTIARAPQQILTKSTWSEHLALSSIPAPLCLLLALGPSSSLPSTKKENLIKAS